MSNSSIRISLAAVVVCASFTTLIAFTSPALAGGESVVVTASAAKPVPMATRMDRDEVAGSYRMSDGRLLTVRSRVGVVIAELGDLPSTSLRASSPTMLHSADKRMSMSFHKDRDDNLFVTVTLAAEGAAPQVIASAARLVR